MKYVCPICGYIYDEEKVSFAELPDSWVCPLCGAVKSTFSAEAAIGEVKNDLEPVKLDEDMKKVSTGVISAIFSNLARGCEKQYKPEEMKLFAELAEYFKTVTPKEENADIHSLEALIAEDLNSGYSALRAVAQQENDRGTQRICVWGEKVTAIANSLMGRYKADGDEALKNTEIWVCSVCGFIYIGDTAPKLCPVCKVPDWKFEKIEGRAN